MSTATTHGGNVYEAARNLNLPAHEVLDFSANINPLGLALQLQDHFLKSLWRIKHYPDPACLEAREALALCHNCETEEIVVGNGAAEIFQLLMLALKPQRVLAFEPTYSGYAFAARTHGVPYVPLLAGLEPWSQLHQKLEEVLMPRDMVFCCTPNNPTGQIIDKDCITALIEITARFGAYLVVDESFYDFLPEHLTSFSCISLNPLPPHVIVVRSLTKILALPGLRLGYARAAMPIAERLRVVRDPWSVNVLALEAAKLYPALETYIGSTREIVATENKFLRQALTAQTYLKVVSGDVNFLLLRIESPHLTSSHLCSLLYHQGILLRNCNSFMSLGEKYIRVAVRTRTENQLLIRELAKVVP